ncbi:MAG: phage holin family protein [Myxococcales bacterium]|nr:phage holin family protein [Myxococcales bacterium]
MGLLSQKDDRVGLAAHLSQLADGVSRLVAQHVRLARHELAQDARVAVNDSAWLVCCAAIALLGYALLQVTLALLIGRRLGLELSFALVAAANLALGGAGAWAAWARMKARPVLKSSLAELEQSASALKGEGAKIPERANGK